MYRLLLLDKYYYYYVQVLLLLLLLSSSLHHNSFSVVHYDYHEFLSQLLKMYQQHLRCYYLFLVVDYDNDLMKRTLVGLELVNPFSSSLSILSSSSPLVFLLFLYAVLAPASANPGNRER